MTPRPFYRSRLFWLGLPGLVFLLWGWWLSMGNWSAASSRGSLGWGIAQSKGEVIVWWRSGEGPNWKDFDAEHSEIPEKDASEIRNYIIFVRETEPGFRLVFFPYYWLVLAYTATWLLTLALWQRRKSRLLKLHAAP